MSKKHIQICCSSNNLTERHINSAQGCCFQWRPKGARTASQDEDWPNLGRQQAGIESESPFSSDKWSTIEDPVLPASPRSPLGTPALPAAPPVPLLFPPWAFTLRHLARAFWNQTWNMEIFWMMSRIGECVWLEITFAICRCAWCWGES